jgi:hypothetical protein
MHGTCITLPMFPMLSTYITVKASNVECIPYIVKASTATQNSRQHLKIVSWANPSDMLLMKNFAWEMSSFFILFFSSNQTSK